MANDTDDIRKLILQAESLLTRARYLLDREFTGFPKEFEDLVNKRICLGCREKIPKGNRVFRGNHESCYRRVYRKIQDGVLSDGEAVDAGLLTPAAPGGKPRKFTHLDEYLTVREQKTTDYAVEKKAGPRKQTGKQQTGKRKTTSGKGKPGKSASTGKKSGRKN